MQTEGELPIIFSPESASVPWEFSSKPQLRAKYGDLNTPIIIKLCAKYNAIKTEPRRIKLNTEQEAFKVVDRLNATIKHKPLPFVTEFFCKSRFVNIFIAEPGRTQIHKELHPEAEEAEPTEGFVMKPIGHLQSCFREKFGTPR